MAVGKDNLATRKIPGRPGSRIGEGAVGCTPRVLSKCQTRRLEGRSGGTTLKRDPVHGGILEFGTELVIASDRSIVAMLGPSPGASTAVWIMLQVIERSFPEKLKTGGWSSKLKQMIPSYGQSLIENAALCRQVRAETAAVLNLNNIDQPVTQARARIA
jgi:Malate:quinone oxidoreductase (Mqo)